MITKFLPFLLLASVSSIFAQSLPNVLWIVVEDQSKHYGFNGEPLVKTPVLDKLCKDGVRFANASVTAPVCSTARSALITGMYQTSIGAHHHRSGRGEMKIQKPAHVKLIPELFKEAGYYTCLGTIGHVAGSGRRNYPAVGCRLRRADGRLPAGHICSRRWHGAGGCTRRLARPGRGRARGDRASNVDRSR